MNGETLIYLMPVVIIINIFISATITSSLPQQLTLTEHFSVNFSKGCACAILLLKPPYEVDSLLLLDQHLSL